MQQSNLVAQEGHWHSVYETWGRGLKVCVGYEYLLSDIVLLEIPAFRELYKNRGMWEQGC